MTDGLIGKYFMCFYDNCGEMYSRNGMVEARVGDNHYLVRLDNYSEAPMTSRLTVVAIAKMTGAGDLVFNGDMPWEFFDTAEQRAAYERWLDEPTMGKEPCVVPMKTGEMN
jgi:hypothetical protein